MRYWMIAATLGVAAFAAPLAAQYYGIDSRIRVTPVEGGFLVADGGAFGARSTWCAAARYARRELGAGGHTRIYVKEPRSRAAGGTVFTLNPAGLTPTSALVVGQSIRQPGANLSVDHASLFCADQRLPSR